MPRLADVVIVGGGIGGASLALALAASGLGVTVIESTVEYGDRVRGECIVAWGVNEARRLGVEDVLLKAGGTDFPAREPRSIFWRPAELPVCRGATRLPEQNPLVPAQRSPATTPGLRNHSPTASC